MSAFPIRRDHVLIVSTLGEDLIVYDERVHAVHTLKEAAVRAWQACDGESDVESIAKSTGLSPDLVNHLMSQLATINLIEGYAVPQDSRSRRSVIRRAAEGTVVAIPFIISVSAPSSAHHASGQCHPAGAPCSTDDDCCGTTYPNGYCLLHDIASLGLFCGGFSAGG